MCPFLMILSNTLTIDFFFTFYAEAIHAVVPGVAVYNMSVPLSDLLFAFFSNRGSFPRLTFVQYFITCSSLVILHLFSG